MRWRYTHVLDGLALVVPADRVGELSAIAGVIGVYPSVRYRALPTRSGGARSVLPDLVQAFGDGGRGIKIGIIDDGIDPDHVYFDPSGFTAPNGFPKGDATLHDREDHRRAGVSAARSRLEVRRAGRSIP